MRYDLPVYSQVMDQYGKFFEDVKAGKIVSAYALDGKGLAAAVSKMAFGNALGVKLEHNVAPEDLFAAEFGDIVAEVPAEKVGQLSITYTVVGEVTDRAALEYSSVSIPLDEALAAWKGTLEKVFRTGSGQDEGAEARFFAGKPDKAEGYLDEEGCYHADFLFTYADIKWQFPEYLFRYSREQTVNMTAQRHLSGPEPR